MVRKRWKMKAMGLSSSYPPPPVINTDLLMKSHSKMLGKWLKYTYVLKSFSLMGLGKGALHLREREGRYPVTRTVRRARQEGKSVKGLALIAPNKIVCGF